MRSSVHTLAAGTIMALLALQESVTALDCTGVSPASGDELRAVLVTSALSSPVDATSPPGDSGRLFVVEQPGTIRILDLAGDSLVAQPFLDIRARVEDGGEKGLLGLAFHPLYAENGYFFLNYTRMAPGTQQLQTVVARYSVSGDPDAADPGSEKILLSFSQPYSNHNGGQVLFGPLDGYLYISTGDGGSGGDPQNNGQNPKTLLGKMLRIDVDGGDPYAIPPTNPFAGDDAAFGEIWALGLRNPWRVTFDRVTGDAYIADVGQSAWEEVNWRAGTTNGGENYGWRVREGSHPYDGSKPLGPGTLVDPIYEYPHSGAAIAGCSVTGGAVYRGCLMPDLLGTYFFADFCSSWIQTFRVVGGLPAEVRDRTAELNADLGRNRIESISAFGTDDSGEIYICSFPSKLYRIVPANQPPPPGHFVRGESNGDGMWDISDPVHTLLYLFAGQEPTPPCPDALDANDDSRIDVSDAVHSLTYLFAAGAPPGAPFPDCGTDPTEDALDCLSSQCAAAP